jgi:LytS/YehU family sensor histidine kinase
LALGLGYLFAYIPNFELVSPTIFLSGVLFGLRTGTLVGILTYFTFGLLNPMGMSPLPLLITQVFVGTLLGLSGGLCYKKKWNKAHIILPIGILITLLSDILTTSSGFIFFPTKKSFLVYFILGLPFVIWHVFTQGIIYGFVLTPTIQKIQKRRFYVINNTKRNVL